MARGKYLSLEEARKRKDGLKQFAKEHPSRADKKGFKNLLDTMTKGELDSDESKKSNSEE